MKKEIVGGGFNGDSVVEMFRDDMDLRDGDWSWNDGDKALPKIDSKVQWSSWTNWHRDDECEPLQQTDSKDVSRQETEDEITSTQGIMDEIQSLGPDVLIDTIYLGHGKGKKDKKEGLTVTYSPTAISDMKHFRELITELREKTQELVIEIPQT